MAGRKNEGLGGLKGTSGGQRRDDRLAATKSTFETITIDAKNALTVIYMLQSPEDNVVLKAVASLEIYGQRGEENLRFLSSLGILQYLLPHILSKDFVIKRFSQKLMGMLCSLEEFRDQVFKIDNILVTFVDVLEKETDVVVHEFAALTLAELTKEYDGASQLLEVDNCIPTLFQRITSLDPDVQKNCLDVMNHLLNDVYGLDHFIECPNFNITLILSLLPSSYPVIQMLAIEVLKQLLSWRRDTRILFAFRDASGIESILEIMENEEWTDLHPFALDLLINVVDSPDLCDFLLQTGCLMRFINLLDVVDSGPPIEKILGVLGRMAQTPKGRVALQKTEMIKRFCSYLNARVDGVLEPSCMGIAYMAQYAQALDTIIMENPIPHLLEIVTNNEKSLKLRNMATYALSILATEDRRAGDILLKLDKFESLCDILKENKDVAVEFSRNIMQIFNGMSAFEYLRIDLITENLIGTLMNCIQAVGEVLTKDSSLEVDALECLSNFLIELKAQMIFNELGGALKVIGCMKSRYASVREWAGQIVITTSQNIDFVKAFIRNEGLSWLIEQKRSRYSMPSWDSAIEAIFAAFLPAKFAYTGRLDFEDLTEDGFYVTSKPSKKFVLIEEYLENFMCPLHPIYVANFEMFSAASETENEDDTLSAKSSHSESKSQKQMSTKEPVQNLSKYTKMSDRNSGEVYKWTGSLNTYPSVDYDSTSNILGEIDLSERFTQFLPDPYLGEYLENLKKRIAIEESGYGDSNWFCIHPNLVRDRTRIIAEFVAEEMSGFEHGGSLCSEHYKEKFVNEMKFQLGTNILPLGYVRMGDYLERAMLFKLLADRIGFPCALVRGPYGRTWIEISVPVINIQDLQATSREDIKDKSECKIASRQDIPMPSPKPSKSFEKHSNSEDENFWYPKLQTECFKAFPTHFLKANAIVDLIDEPGRIIKMNTREAEEYCGFFLFAKY